MAEAPAYQSGLIAALRGGGNASGVSVPGMTMTPNAPARQGSPMSFGNTSSFGNLMTPPSFAPAQGAAQAPGDFGRFFNPLSNAARPMNGNQTTPQASQPMPSFQPQMTGNLMPAPSFQPPPMTGNLMPAPQFAPAQDYVAPPPTPPMQQTAPQINYEMDDEGNRTGAIIGFNEDGEPYRYFPSFE
jgi:hypothetical protein